MSEALKLPVGIENFREIRENGFYYIDKTKLIEQLLEQWGKVSLFTRHRRFGKTLNMSMLRCFFEIGTDGALFDDLYISKNTKLCEKYLGKYPVVFLSLKNVDGLTFEEAKYKLMELIGMEAERFSFLMNSEKLSENDKNKYHALTQMFEGQYSIPDGSLTSSLQTLSQLLEKYYGQKVIILIDEYDVPLDKAFQHGYYREMVALIRGLFGQALKTNDSLMFAEEWYDGYHFGNTDVYCPWDVINHVDRLNGEPGARPQTYWINTSGNDFVKRFIDNANKTTRDEIERLVAGEAIEKMVRLELTYDEIDNSIDNMWSVLFTTGYLTQTGMTEQGAYKLVIPNKEVREVYKFQIQEWLKKSVFSNTEQLTAFWNGVEEGNTEAIEEYLNRILSNSISVFDTKAPDKESSYHTLLVGLLVGNANWLVKSNVEAGEGFADIIVETEDPDAGIVMELKYVKVAFELEKACEKALAQIKDRRYEEYLKNDGRNNILFYGLAFFKKRCKVIVESRGIFMMC